MMALLIVHGEPQLLELLGWRVGLGELVVHFAREVAQHVRRCPSRARRQRETASLRP